MSPDLIHWTLLTNALGLRGAFSIGDPDAPKFPQRFYQIFPTAITNMVFIRPGTFTMGSPDSEQGHSASEAPQTVVTVTHGFWMGKYEVTQEEFLSLMGSNVSWFTSSPKLPSDSMTWVMATNYCAHLTQKEAAAGRLPTGYVYRLPTEAEWEYACRAVVTPSATTTDGGFKYNPPHGGPADTDATTAIAARANELIEGGLAEVRRTPFAKARAAAAAYDFMGIYVDDLPAVIDLEAIKAAGITIGADPLGGASVHYWGEIATRHGLDLTVVNPLVDATWRFMTLDWDGKIRMDCSSPVRDGLAGHEDDRRGALLPGRHRQRRGRRPARHRHAGRRAAQPQPLPWRWPSSTCSAALAPLGPPARRSARPWCRPR